MADPDAGSAPLKLTLSVAHGKLTLATTAHQVWFTMDHRLFVTSRDTQNTPDAVMQALLAGPTADESGVT